MNSRNKSEQAQTKSKNSKVVLEKLRSDNILRKIVEYMKKIRSLEIIRYNKGLQKRLNLTLKDYKKYSLLIEVELKPVDDKYGKFINIPDGKKKSIHIYFDNSNEETKRHFLKEKEKVKIINIQIDSPVQTFKGLFSGCRCISSIIFKKFSRTNITDMSSMFCGCSSLEELNLSNFNTNNVTNMSYMFSDCSSLEELNLSNFNINKVTNMTYMFHGCFSLEKLNLSNFNTDKITNMHGMFGECSSLKKLNLSSFNTDNVTEMSYMFDKCSALKEINLSSFNTKNVRYMSRMFYKCLSLKELNLSNFNTDNVVDMSDMFHFCSDDLKKKITEQNKNINIDSD